MKKNGFTLIEVLIVMGITVILITLGTVSLSGFRSGQSIEDDARAIATILQTAQSRATSQEDNSRFGVYFDNTVAGPTYTLYRVDEAKVPTDPMPVVAEGLIQVRVLSGGVNFVSPANATGTNIMFTRSTGLPSTSTSIILELNSDPSVQKSITISSTGLISY